MLHMIQHGVNDGLIYDSNLRFSHLTKLESLRTSTESAAVVQEVAVIRPVLAGRFTMCTITHCTCWLSLAVVHCLHRSPPPAASVRPPPNSRSPLLRWNAAGRVSRGYSLVAFDLKRSSPTNQRLRKINHDDFLLSEWAG